MTRLSYLTLKRLVNLNEHIQNSFWICCFYSAGSRAAYLILIKRERERAYFSGRSWLSPHKANEENGKILRVKNMFLFLLFSSKIRIVSKPSLIFFFCYVPPNRFFYGGRFFNLSYMFFHFF